MCAIQDDGKVCKNPPKKFILLCSLHRLTSPIQYYRKYTQKHDLIQ